MVAVAAYPMHTTNACLPGERCNLHDVGDWQRVGLLPSARRSGRLALGLLEVDAHTTGHCSAESASSHERQDA